MVRLELVALLLAILLLPSVGEPQGSTSSTPGFRCPSSVTISQTANAQKITGTAGQKLYLCAIVLWNGATAQTVNVVEGTGTVCATGIAGLLGGTTAATGLSLVASGGAVMIAGNGWIRSATAGNNLCVLQSGTTQLSGVLTYRSAP